MGFFESYFGVDGNGKETAVCCPFPHSAGNTGVTYYEQRPSAHMNTDKRVFNCKVCGAGYNELQFIKLILGCSYADAVKLAQIYDVSTEEKYLWDSSLTLTATTEQAALSYGISDKVIQELSLKSAPTDALIYPVFVYDKLLDIRSYYPNEIPKIKSRAGAMNGLLMPYDVWRYSTKDRPTLICAGEKDMAVARTMGFNAITIIGGEGTLPILNAEFKDRDAVVVYDNDEAGKEGATKLCNHLLEYCKTVRNCTAFHEICKEDKEDITDFFMKYKQSKEELVKYLEITPEYEFTETKHDKHVRLMDLHTASRPENLNKIVRTNIQIVATAEATFVAPSIIIGTKIKEADGNGQVMAKGDYREWYLTEQTVQDLLHMMDNNFNEVTLQKNYKNVLRIMQSEKYIKIQKPTKETIYKCYVTDMFETQNIEVVPMEYTAYSIGAKLESGKKYCAKYKLVPHPYKGQELIMLIMSATEAGDSVSDFRITDKTKKHLDVIRELEGDVDTRITTIVNKVKDVLGYDGNNLLIQTMDLAYHTPLYFNFGTFKNVRGYLDTIIVGESRMGKSTTAEALREMYKLGIFTSLAGNAATIPGLIGGSNKQNGTFQTRAGLIPQNHRGLIIFEELGKSKADIIAELTDIRSSNEVRITRVSGTLTLPAVVRMIALSNVKNINGTIRPIAGYPNGITILQELVHTAEDIARYDISLILDDRGSNTVDPFWVPDTRFHKDVYLTRIRWVWSRKPEQIKISKDVASYILMKSNEINKIYESHIKIFGTEAWKKITRLAIAIAGYLVSTDESYVPIIVKQEHVDYAVKYYESIYNNRTFKLREYVTNERKYRTIDDNGVALLQDVYLKAPGILLHLEQVSDTTKPTLLAVTGMTNEEYNAQMSKLVAGLFVKFEHHSIIPTEKFRLGISRINRNVKIVPLGENY